MYTWVPYEMFGNYLHIQHFLWFLNIYVKWSWPYLLPADVVQSGYDEAAVFPSKILTQWTQLWAPSIFDWRWSNLTCNSDELACIRGVCENLTLKKKQINLLEYSIQFFIELELHLYFLRSLARVCIYQNVCIHISHSVFHYLGYSIHFAPEGKQSSCWCLDI